MRLAGAGALLAVILVTPSACSGQPNAAQTTAPVSKSSSPKPVPTVTANPASPAAISGVYVLNRRITSCAYKKGCLGTPMTIRVACTGSSCTVIRIDSPPPLGPWAHPLPLAFDGQVWRASGQENNASECNGQPAPTTVTLTLKVTSGVAVNGVWKAQLLDGEYTVMQGPTTCNNNAGSAAAEEVATLVPGKWPGNTAPYYASNGPYYAEQYFDYPDPQPTTTTVCQSDGTGCVEDAWHYYWGQCTSWVAWRLNEANGSELNGTFTNNYLGQAFGDAKTWKGAEQNLDPSKVNTTPALGSVAWWPDSRSHRGGHVAYVEEVISPTEIVISEMNYDNQNGFWVHTINKATDPDWPTKFIHIADR